MYRVQILWPNKEERDRLLEQGITTMCCSIVESMHFETMKDARTYLEYIGNLYPELSIRYSIHMDKNNTQ